jgi:hypothetical protein
MEKIITFCFQKAKVRCDEKCNKAFGISSRPFIKLSDNVDDIVRLSDDEVGEAPIDPGTYEGGDAKPIPKDKIPNKWCVRECERCSMSQPEKYNEPLNLKDWSKRVYNFKDRQC